jgi:mitochondrial transcription factor 1
MQRLSAGPLDAMRCKLSVIANATADLSPSVPSDQLLPYDNHFHPTIPKHYHFTATQKSEHRRIGHPMLAINILPLEKQVCCTKISV